MTSSVSLHKEDSVLRVTMGNDGTPPALDYASMIDLTDGISAAANDPAVRVLVLEGANGDFCVGDNPSEMGQWPKRHADRLHQGSWAETPIPQQDLLRTLWRLPRPTVAVIRGAALGFGLDLACACDIRLTAADARFGDSRILNGIATATGITYLLPRLVGLSQAMRLLLLGDVIDGTEAHRIGLAYRSVSPECLADEAGLLVAQVASMATRSYALIKRQIIDQLDLDHDTALLHSLAIRQTHVIEDQKEGLAAFREKRTPRFSGR